MYIEINARYVFNRVVDWEWVIYSGRQRVVEGTEDTQDRAKARAQAVLLALTGPIPVK